jgi:hypothetical protein
VNLELQAVKNIVLFSAYFPNFKKYKSLMRSSCCLCLFICVVSVCTLNFFIWYSGGVEPNWFHSALRPPIGLLCHPREIMMMEKLVEWWLAGETEVLGENLAQCRFVHHKHHMLYPGRRGGKRATNRLSYGTAYLVWLLLCSRIILCWNIMLKKKLRNFN